MKIEHSPGRTVIPQIAKEDSETPPKQVNIAWMPSSMDKVKFYYEPTKLNINFRQGKVSIKGQPNQPIIHYNRGDFQIYLKQKAQIQFQAVNSSVNKII